MRRWTSQDAGRRPEEGVTVRLSRFAAQPYRVVVRSSESFRLYPGSSLILCRKVAVRISKRGRKGTWRRGERKALLLIFLITACPVALTLSVIAVSSRPDLYYVTPKSLDPGVKAVSWQTLNKIMSAPGFPGTAEVAVEGYMIAAEGFPAVNGRVARFLLVPDPGNWLYAPHLDSDEAIDVRLSEATPLLPRRAVIVRGTLSFGSMETKPRGATCHLSATSVRAL